MAYSMVLVFITTSLECSNTPCVRIFTLKKYIQFLCLSSDFCKILVENFKFLESLMLSQNQSFTIVELNVGQ